MKAGAWRLEVGCCPGTPNQLSIALLYLASLKLFRVANLLGWVVSWQVGKSDFDEMQLKITSTNFDLSSSFVFLLWSVSKLS